MEVRVVDFPEIRPTATEHGEAPDAATNPRCSGRRFAAFAAAAALAALAALAANHALAQHATAFDVRNGARVYEAACANCHGPDGDLIAGMDFGRGVYRQALSDEQIAEIIVNGIAATPMPANPGMSRAQALEVVAYLRSMPSARAASAGTGNPERGRALVDGKGECLDCHRIDRRGSRLGPSLTRIGETRRASELERSLLDPEAEVLPENRYYTVVPSGGEPVTGRLLNHDTFTVQLVDPEERLRTFRKADLAEHGFATTPMPSYRGELTPEEIADIVSYLVTLKDDSAP